MRRTGPYQPGRAELSHVKDESFYPWEGGNQSPKKSLSQPSKKGVTEITYKLHTFCRGSLTLPCHTATLEPVSALTMAPRCYPVNKSPPSGPAFHFFPTPHPWDPSIDAGHSEIFIKYPLIVSVAPGHPTYDLSPPKRFEKMPVQLH